jgi:hypothetical protein
MYDTNTHGEQIEKRIHNHIDGSLLFTDLHILADLINVDMCVKLTYIKNNETKSITKTVTQLNPRANIVLRLGSDNTDRVIQLDRGGVVTHPIKKLYLMAIHDKTSFMAKHGRTLARVGAVGTGLAVGTAVASVTGALPLVANVASVVGIAGLGEAAIWYTGVGAPTQLSSNLQLDDMKQYFEIEDEIREDLRHHEQNTRNIARTGDETDLYKALEKLRKAQMRAEVDGKTADEIRRDGDIQTAYAEVHAAKLAGRWAAENAKARDNVHKTRIKASQTTANTNLDAAVATKNTAERERSAEKRRECLKCVGINSMCSQLTEFAKEFMKRIVISTIGSIVLLTIVPVGVEYMGSNIGNGTNGTNGTVTFQWPNDIPWARHASIWAIIWFILYYASALWSILPEFVQNILTRCGHGKDKDAKEPTQTTQAQKETMESLISQLSRTTSTPSDDATQLKKIIALMKQKHSNSVHPALFTTKDLNKMKPKVSYALIGSVVLI